MMTDLFCFVLFCFVFFRDNKTTEEDGLEFPHLHLEQIRRKVLAERADASLDEVDTFFFQSSKLLCGAHQPL